VVTIKEGSLCNFAKHQFFLGTYVYSIFAMHLLIQKHIVLLYMAENLTVFGNLFQKIFRDLQKIFLADKRVIVEHVPPRLS